MCYYLTDASVVEGQQPEEIQPAVYSVEYSVKR
jgi:hypothetical protein